MDLRSATGDSTLAGAALAVSSSDIPFLKALMPCATSPISSEILPRPNSSSTTPMTMIQCQRLIEPIGITLRRDPGRGLATHLQTKLGLGRGKNKHPAHR